MTHAISNSVGVAVKYDTWNNTQHKRCHTGIMRNHRLIFLKEQGTTSKATATLQMKATLDSSQLTRGQKQSGGASVDENERRFVERNNNTHARMGEGEGKGTYVYESQCFCTAFYQDSNGLLTDDVAHVLQSSPAGTCGRVLIKGEGQNNMRSQHTER